jgi:hypothetical protein
MFEEFVSEDREMDHIDVFLMFVFFLISETSIVVAIIDYSS